MELFDSHCLCRSEDYRVLFPQKIEWSTFSADEFSARRKRNVQHFRIVRCNACGLVRSDPVLSAADLALLYRESRFLYPRESGYAARTYASLVTRFLPLLPHTEQLRLLEVGCGNGSFLEEMQRRGLQAVVGVEPSVHAVEHAPGAVKTAIVNEAFHRALFPPGTFDVVCAFHLVDHLHDPAGFIEECFRILDKRGIVILVCHDVDALINKVLGEQSPVFDVEHTFLFNPGTLHTLAASCGFVPRGNGRVTNTYPLSYWLRYVPVVNRLVEYLPRSAKNIPLTLYAGNIYLCAQKG